VRRRLYFGPQRHVGWQQFTTVRETQTAAIEAMRNPRQPTNQKKKKKVK
jgi:hypothetical protein